MTDVTPTDKNFRLLEDSIVKVQSVIEKIQQIKPRSPRENRELANMALVLIQVVSNLLKLERKLYGKTASRSK